MPYPWKCIFEVRASFGQISGGPRWTRWLHRTCRSVDGWNYSSRNVVTAQSELCKLMSRWYIFGNGTERGGGCSSNAKPLVSIATPNCGIMISEVMWTNAPVVGGWEGGGGCYTEMQVASAEGLTLLQCWVRSQSRLESVVPILIWHWHVSLLSCFTIMLWPKRNVGVSNSIDIIGVDLFSRLGGGGGDRCSMRGSEVTERGGGDTPSQCTDFFQNYGVSKLHFRAFKNSGELNVAKFHGEELPKELFIEYRLKTIHFNTRSLASLEF